MTKMVQRVLIGIVMAAVITGATAAYQAAALPIDGTQIATLDDLRAALPRDTQYYRETTRLNQEVLREITGGVLPGDDGKDWSETVIYAAYDPAGRVIAIFSEADDRPMLSLNEYDRADNRVRGAMYRDRMLSMEIQTIFDEEGREISSETRSGNEISSRSERTYEPQPDGTTRAAVTVYDAGGTVIEQDIHILDSKNRAIHSEINFGGYTTVADYAYDDKDRLIHSVVGSGNDDKHDTTFRYTDSADGTICTYEQYENGVLQSRYEQQFDARGVCVYQVEYTAEGVLASETIREPLE